MGVGAGVLSERARIFVGLDLGQSQDPTALSIVERAEVFPGEMDWVSYERPRAQGFGCCFCSGCCWGRPIQEQWSGCGRLWGEWRGRANARWWWMRRGWERPLWTCFGSLTWV